MRVMSGEGFVLGRRWCRSSAIMSALFKSWFIQNFQSQVVDVYMGTVELILGDFETRAFSSLSLYQYTKTHSAKGHKNAHDI